MTTIANILNNIEQKVRLLTTQLGKIERENSILTEKNRELMAQNRTLQTNLLLSNSEISHLQTQLETENKIEKGKEGQKQNPNLKREISQYIQEIDQCIEWLQKD